MRRSLFFPLRWESSSCNILLGSKNHSHSQDVYCVVGDVPKWLKGPHSKCGRSAQTGARVQISSSPPEKTHSDFLSVFFLFIPILLNNYQGYHAIARLVYKNMIDMDLYFFLTRKVEGVSAYPGQSRKITPRPSYIREGEAESSRTPSMNPQMATAMVARPQVKIPPTSETSNWITPRVVKPR